MQKGPEEGGNQRVERVVGGGKCCLGWGGGNKAMAFFSKVVLPMNQESVGFISCFSPVPGCEVEGWRFWG